MSVIIIYLLTVKNPNIKILFFKIQDIVFFLFCTYCLTLPNMAIAPFRKLISKWFLLKGLPHWNHMGKLNNFLSLRSFSEEHETGPASFSTDTAVPMALFLQLLRGNTEDCSPSQGHLVILSNHRMLNVTAFILVFPAAHTTTRAFLECSVFFSDLWNTSVGRLLRAESWNFPLLKVA